MKLIRVIVNVAVAAIIIGTAALVGSRGASAAPTFAGGTVNFASWSSNPTESEGLKKLLNTFQSKYKIKVNYTVFNNNYDASLKTRMTAGTAPDVFYIDSSQARAYIQLGVLHDLNYLKSVKSFGFNEFYKNVQQGFVSGGHTYGFAKDYSTLVLFYNKTMFAAKGIKSPPTTWSQLQADACKLTDKSKKVYGAVISADPARWLAFVYQAGGSLLNGSQSKATIDSPAGLSALNFYAGLYQKGCAALPSDVGAGWNGEAFGRGNAAMVIEGNWLTSAMQQTYPDIKWGIAKLPKGKTYGDLIFTASYSMWAKTPNFKQATQLMEFLAGKQGEQIWSKVVSYIPSRKDVKPPAGTQPYIQQVKYSHSWFFPPGFTDRALTPIGNDLQAVMQGKMSADSAIKDMQAKATAGLTQAP